MRRARPILIVTILALGSSILFLTVGGNRTKKFHAQSLLKLEVRETHLYPAIYRDEAAAISNCLRAVGRPQLPANPVRAGETGCALEQVGPIRGTSLFHIDYSGPDSNAVKVAASKAASLTISFYATNQPSWQVTLVETRCFTPLSTFDRVKESVWIYSRRCKEFLGL